MSKVVARATHLFALLSSRGDGQRLAEAVNQFRDVMLAADEGARWHFWNGHALLLCGDTDGAFRAADEIKKQEGADALRISIHQRLADKGGDSKPLIQALTERHARTKDPLHLFQLCETLAVAGQWTEIAPHAESLIQEIQTVAAHCLAVKAAESSGSVKLALKFIDEGGKFYPEGRVPLDMLRLRIELLCRDGRPDMAAPEAERVAAETDDSRDLIHLVEVRLAAADLKGAVLAARSLLGRDDVSAESHLRLAHWLKLEDRVAAVAHLDRALQKHDGSPQFLATAMALAFRLKSEAHAAKIQPAFAKAAQEGGPIQVVGPDRLRQMVQDGNKGQAEMERLHTAGQTPAHILAEPANASFAVPFLEGFTFTGNSLSPRAVFAVHGGRSKTGSISSAALIVDLSGLLLAHKLGLLDTVEQAFETLLLPASALALLYKQIDLAEVHQPSQVDEAKAILSLVQRGLIHPMPALQSVAAAEETARPARDWIALNAKARETNGLLVDYVPVTRGLPPVPADLLPEETQTTVGIGSIALSLQHAGRLTAAQIRVAESHIGMGIQSGRSDIPLGSNLYLRGNLGEVLAAAGLLQATAEAFHLWIEESAHTRAQKLVETDLRLGAMNGDLQELRERIRRGLGHKWRPMPAIAESATAGGPEMACLQELVLATTAPEDACAWIDDRMLNGFATCGRHGIVSVLDVLQEVQRRKLITSDFYHDCLFRLRSANIRFIPLSNDEIEHHLNRASIVDGKVVESPELRVLRQYAASCFAASGVLQMPPPNAPATVRGELDFVMAHMEACREAMMTLWTKVDVETAAEVEVRSTWILESLWCDPAALSWVFASRSNVTDELHGSALAQLYFHGLALKGPSRHDGVKGSSPRVIYFRWLQKHFTHDQDSLAACAKFMREMFFTEKWDGEEEQSQVARFLVGDFFGDLPEHLQRALKLPASRLLQFNVQYADVINFGAFCFDPALLWQAATQAAAGQEAVVGTQNQEARFRLQLRLDRKIPALFFTPESGDANFCCEHLALNLLRRKASERLAAIRRHPEAFDCAEEIFYRETARLSALPNAGERIEKFERWRERSGATFYARLVEKLKRPDLTLNDLRPRSPNGLLDHLRVKAENTKTPSDLVRAFESSAAELLRTVGFREAYERFSSLPVVLPDVLRSAFRIMPPATKEAFFSSFNPQKLSPASQVHYLRLLAEHEPVRCSALVKEITAKSEEPLFRAFKATLLWTETELRARPEFGTMSFECRMLVIWLHSSRIFNLLYPQSEAEQMTDFFSESARLGLTHIFHSDLAYRMDQASPIRVHRETFYVHGLGGLSPDSFSATDRELIATAFRELCFVSGHPHPMLVVQSDWLTNKIGSFLSGDRGALLRPWIASDADNLANAQLSPFLLRTIEAAKQNENPSTWRFLELIYGAFSPPEEIERALEDLANNVQGSLIAELPPEDRRSAVSFFGMQACRKAALRGPVRELLVKVAQHREANHSEVTKADVVMIVEAAHTLSRGENSVRAASAAFNSLLLRILEAWPKSTAEVWKALKHLPPGLPPTILAEIWPLVFHLRSRAGP